MTNQVLVIWMKLANAVSHNIVDISQTSFYWGFMHNIVEFKPAFSSNTRNMDLLFPWAYKQTLIKTCYCL